MPNTFFRYRSQFVYQEVSTLQQPQQSCPSKSSSQLKFRNFLTNARRLWIVYIEIEHRLIIHLQLLPHAVFSNSAVSGFSVCLAWKNVSVSNEKENSGTLSCFQLVEVFFFFFFWPLFQLLYVLTLLVLHTS